MVFSDAFSDQHTQDTSVNEIKPTSGQVLMKANCPHDEMGFEPMTSVPHSEALHCYCLQLLMIMTTTTTMMMVSGNGRIMMTVTLSFRRELPREKTRLKCTQTGHSLAGVCQVMDTIAGGKIDKPWTRQLPAGKSTSHGHDNCRRENRLSGHPWSFTANYSQNPLSLPPQSEPAQDIVKTDLRCK